jgi:anaerobic magnesium-protoporphyrin IX monomethyl ester cyclase
MRVLLVNPPYYRLVGERKTYVPMALLHLAAVLRSTGVEALVFNADASPIVSGRRDLGYYEKHVLTQYILLAMNEDCEVWREFRQTVHSFRPEVIGISVYSETVPVILWIIEAIARDFPGTRIVLGGPHFCGSTRPFLDDTSSVVFIGEAEHSLVGFCNAVGGGATGERIIEGGQIEDLDGLPLPRLEYLAPDDIAKGIGGKVMIHSARGCPYNCRFCYSGSKGGSIRSKSAARVAQELNYFSEQYGIRRFYFTDDTFATHQHFLLDLASRIRDCGYIWSCMSHVATLRDDKITLLAKMGCRAIHIGVEAATQRMLDVLGKASTINRVRQVCRQIKAEGMEVRAFVMVGIPTETQEDREAILEFSTAVSPNELAIQVYQPYPGTAMFASLLREGKIAEPNWRAFSRYGFFSSVSYFGDKEKDECLQMLRAADAYNSQQSMMTIGL